MGSQVPLHHTEAEFEMKSRGQKQLLLKPLPKTQSPAFTRDRLTFAHHSFPLLPLSCLARSHSCVSGPSFVCHLAEHQRNIIYVKQVEDIGPLFLCWRINSLGWGGREVVLFSFFMELGGGGGEEEMTK